MRFADGRLLKDSDSNANQLSKKIGDPKRRWILIRFLQWMAGFGLGYIGWRYIQGEQEPPRIVYFARKPHTGEVILHQGAFLVGLPTGLRAFSARCPHLGCRLHYHAATRRFQCPCHGSRFAINGSRLAGPAAKDMNPLILDAIAKGDEPGAAFKTKLPPL